MKAFCDYFNQGICHSCDQIQIDYPDQIKGKEVILKRGLENFGSFQFLESVQSKTLGFRNKAKVAVTGSLEIPIIGLSGNTQLDQGREILNCLVHHPKINQVLSELKHFITLSRLVPYSIENKTGELKGLILFYSEASDEMYLRFILRSKESLDRIRKNSNFLTQIFPFIQCITANIQPIPHAILEGPEEILLAGKPSIKHLLNKVELEIRPKAFIQTNQIVSQELYQTAAAWIKELGTTKFCELYCGQGAFSFFAAPFVKESLGIEINAEAIQAANAFAQKIGLSHLQFIASDASDIEMTLSLFSADTVLVNPPRKGLGTALELFKKKTYPHFIYSSCSHESLIHDLKQLPNYQIEKVQIFDMFPHTTHFETLVLLSGK